jgi:hypothetical protein
VTLQEVLEFAAQGGEPSGLYFDQEVISHQIDHIPIDGMLDQVTPTGVPEFQRRMQRPLVQRTDHRLIVAATPTCVGY